MSNYSTAAAVGILERSAPSGVASSRNIRRSADEARCDEAFWRAIVKHRDVTERDLGYLTAYVEMEGSRFPAPGIPTADGQFIVLDKAVMSSVLDKGLVSLSSDGYFELSHPGRLAIGLR